MSASNTIQCIERDLGKTHYSNDGIWCKPDFVEAQRFVNTMLRVITTIYYFNDGIWCKPDFVEPQRFVNTMLRVIHVRSIACHLRELNMGGEDNSPHKFLSYTQLTS